MNLHAAAFLLVVPLAGAAGELAVSSPFGASMAPQDGQSPRESLELRGLMPADDGMQYCIFDTARNRSTWATLSERTPGFVITSADPASGRVVIEEAGRVVTLALREGRVMPATPEGIASERAIAFVPLSRRQPGEARAPRKTQ